MAKRFGAISISLGLHFGLLFLLFYWSGGGSPLPLGASLEVMTPLERGKSAQKPAEAPAATPNGATKNNQINEDSNPIQAASEAAPPVGVSDGSLVDAKERYKFELNLYLQQNQKYPARARALGQSGSVQVRFRIEADGKFSEVQIAKESPYASLNQEALDLFRRLGSFRPPPAAFGVDNQFSLAIVFALK